MLIKKSVCDLVGNTPLMQLSSYSAANGVRATLLAKLEMFNPAGSVKDRVAAAMIKKAEADGLLKKGATIIEPTSGNTGIGLASIASALGYKVILTMPETMSVERRSLLAAYGAQLVLTSGSKGMAGAIEKAKQLNAEIEGSLILSQFSNPANPQAHYDSTAPEIWRDTGGKIDILVAGIGTGGTISGIGRFLKEKNPAIRVVGVEPQGSPVITAGRSGGHKIQGIGAGFVPDNFDSTVCDEVIAVSDSDAYKTAKLASRSEGILFGISSGAALFAATCLAALEENKGKTIVVIMPDNGERYLSTGLFD